MPVRIYDIAKKYGLENKQILEKAKSLGIAAAKVPSSSLDKISAEWLEGELLKDYPDIAAKFAHPPAPEKPKPAPADEEIKIISAPPPPPPAPTAPPPPPAAPAPVAPEGKAEPAVPPAQPPPVSVEKPKPAAPPPPPPKAGPKVGEKVGFIQLPARPQQPPRGGDRGGTGTGKMPPHRPGAPPPRREERPRDGGQRDGRAQPPREAAKPAAPAAPKFVAPETGEIITIKPPIVVRDLANALKQKPFIIIGDLMKLGVFATVNQAIEEKIARQICAKYGFRFEVEKRERGAGVVHAPEKKVELDFEDKPEELKPRAPVVTIMGHVDHGKTTLLDVIRRTNVAAGEAGGITQHIGAYTISVPHPERKNELAQITFLDTPGHAAFSSMRARGANVTDVVVLVVAANDGVMPQTLEALNHAKAAKVPILVAVNKIDHPNATPLKVRQQLQDKGLVPDDWGGDTIFVDVSALTKQGIDKLLEMILLQADLLELKANPNRRAKGNVIESGVEPGGPTATVLVRKGTLHVGDIILCGEFYGRVRALINEENQRLKEAGPSVAVKVLGLNGVPDAGLEFSVVEDEKAARELASQREFEARVESQEDRKVTLENLFATLQAAQSKVLKVVVKADAQGSVEAIVDALKKIESEKVSLEIIHSDVGAITENDVALASASAGVILGFHTRVDSTAAEKAKREGVQIKLYAIIYELIDQVKEAMAGLLEPDTKETVIGSAEVRKIFELSKGAPVAGCMVSTGRIVRGKVRVRRRKDVIYEGVTQSLRRFQDEVNEVRAGMECGIRIEGFGEFEVGDAIECYTIEKVAAKL
ncbi:MAG TPA: translation initiation factor IF-2 [Candidatus Sulfotelmatobacter sp.]|nr:translation initiation factor IF-2 [Candidatus Sulfotelmatobacter sp.]